jgi:NAD(P)-dependent dehydrogenase (short-subunit alcohol dehydrogenase family)
MIVLEHKIAVITGAASGIGRATALLFARHGAHVVCIDDQAADETLAAIHAEKMDARYIRADVADSAEVKAAAAQCAAWFDKVDILFNNAGRIRHETFEATTEETWAEMLAVNLTGEFLCARHLLPLMKKSGSASIINHASIDGALGNPCIAAYSAAKGGLIPLTHVMAHDLGKYNIRVNAISSGGIQVRRNATTASGAAPGASRIAVTPLQRLGTADEVAHVALFLAADWSSYVNGANIVVDGGRTGITQGTYHGYD